jgi:hypothetical protein
MQKNCDTSNVKPEVTRYKIEFKMFAGSLVKAGCHIEDQGDAFKHIWTRISIKDEIRDPWQDMKNIDIIRPRRYNTLHTVILLGIRVAILAHVIIVLHRQYIPYGGKFSWGPINFHGWAVFRISVFAV